MPPPQELILLDESFAICRLDPGAEVPAWALESPFVSITRTRDELSVVCPGDRVPEGIRADRGWRCLSVRGPLALDLTGILAALATPLATAGVNLFAISTFETDHLLVRGARLDRAIAALRGAGHVVVEDQRGGQR
jgi:hypothetical protein